MQVIWTNRNGGVSKKVGGMSQTEVNKFLEEQEARLEAEFEVEIIELNEAHAAEIEEINTVHDAEIDTLNTAHAEEVAGLNTTIGGLNTTIDGLEAEIDELEEALEAAKPLPEEAFVLTGDCQYRFAYDGWDWFIENYGDKVRTEDISGANCMFYYCSMENIPFELNMVDKETELKNTFFNCTKLKSVPKINNLKPKEVSGLFRACYNLREIPDDYCDTWDWSYIESQTGTYSGIVKEVFPLCYSLRKFPSFLISHVNPNSAYSNSYFYTGFSDCCTLDEIVDLPIRYTATWTSNAFSSAFNNCHRLKNITFEMPDGQPKVVNWKSQSIYLTNIGHASASHYESKITDYNSGITADKKVRDDATYQALKNDPDWFTMDSAYSRYNHDSAVATINSLPDTSAYLATAGGTNTITFTGAAGSKTDGGAINTLTAEEIAVAAAKGWTVTLV